jgi:hypothetical protein
MGASNLARGYSALADCLVRCLAPEPVEILHAMGPGRGYCAEGGFLKIKYPPIGSCGILQSAIERAEKARRVIALITDIGSDIMYGVPVSELISCLNTLIQKLNAIDAEVFVHPIPLDFSEDVPKRQFRILRSIYFPNSVIDYEQAKEAVALVNGFLRAQAGERVHLLPSAKEFLGIDKIHYSVFQSHKAWSEVVVEILRVIPVEKMEKIGWLPSIRSMFDDMGRLVFCDMIPIRKKSPQTY